MLAIAWLNPYSLNTPAGWKIAGGDVRDRAAVKAVLVLVPHPIADFCRKIDA
jgi:hypothetical protein